MTGNAAQQELLTQMRETIVRQGEHIAVREHDAEYSYSGLGELIAAVHQALGRAAQGAAVGLLLGRSTVAYAAMWAAISRGIPYVPLNTSYPCSRLRHIIAQAGITQVICTKETAALAGELGLGGSALVIAAPDMRASKKPDSDWWQASETGDDSAYVLFTSGSTGAPKGVPISYLNLAAFVANMSAAIPYQPDDVCAQMCELSFDFSVEEIYLSLLHGRTLCPARQVDLFNPAQFIASRGITVWISVPSLARVILTNGVPVGDSLHNLRLSIFNGERLTAELARAWLQAAPNTQIWNSYGPTECTVAVTTQRWHDDTNLEYAGGVAIGRPFADCKVALLNDDTITHLADTGSAPGGELLLATPQRFAGYTDRQLPAPFVTDPGGCALYRTGDRVCQRDGKLFHLGRTDDQVKVGGHRIELMEIEHQLRKQLATSLLAVIAYPASLPTELVLFLADQSSAPELNAEALGLPAYMLPKRTVLLDALPLNSHGKLDRSALQTLAGASA